MEQGQEGGNSFSEQVIHEFLVECNSGWVDRIISSSHGNDSRPRNRETIGFRPGALEEGNILGGSVVRIAGYIPRGSVGNLPWNLAEFIPDGGPTAVFFWGTFNLVAASVLAQDGTGQDLTSSPRGCEAPEEVIPEDSSRHVWYCYSSVLERGMIVEEDERSVAGNQMEEQLRLSNLLASAVAQGITTSPPQ